MYYETKTNNERIQESHSHIAVVGEAQSTLSRPPDEGCHGGGSLLEHNLLNKHNTLLLLISRGDVIRQSCDYLCQVSPVIRG